MKGVKSKDITELAVVFLDSFRDIAEYTNDQLLEYMNKNNAWAMFNDDMEIGGLAGASIEDTVLFIGRYLTRDEQNNIISRYNSRFQHSYKNEE